MVAKINSGSSLYGAVIYNQEKVNQGMARIISGNKMILDIDTLSIAIDALDNLQTQGRKIGVISHVEEMKERITPQIQVIKSANGRSSVKIVG